MKKITIVLLILLVAGCASVQRTTNFYTIDTYDMHRPEPDRGINRAPLPFAVEIVDFSIAGPYNDPRIALRTESNELQYYHYHQWAELPGSSIRYLIWRILHEAQVFDVTQLRLTVRAPDLIITGAINTLERIEIDDQTGAHIDASMELIDTRQQRVLVTHDFRQVVLFSDESSMNHFAQETSRVFHEEVRAFIDKIFGHFASAEAGSE